MRALLPDRTGVVEPAGVSIYFEVFDRPDVPSLLLVAPSPITHSRIWKALLPNLARRYRVVTFDGRGNGRSGRPTKVEEHTRAANLTDIVGVLDASDTDSAVVVAHCHANWWVVDLIDVHPLRVEAFVAIAPGVPYLGRSQPHWAATATTWADVLPDVSGWQLFNRHAITHDHRRWVQFFFSQQLVEPHSTKQLEDAVSWALESTGEILAASEEAQDLAAPDRLAFEQQCRRIAVPTLVVHGDQDVCQHVDKGRAFAELVGAELLVLEGAGHLALVRDPVRVNRAITDFVDRATGQHLRARRTQPTLSVPPGRQQ